MSRFVCRAFLFSLVAGSRAPSDSENADKQILRVTEEDNLLLQVAAEDNRLLQVRQLNGSEKTTEEDVLVEEPVADDEAPQLCDEPLLVDVKQGDSYATVMDSLYVWGSAWNYSETVINGLTENWFSSVDDLADEFNEVLFCPTLLDLIKMHLDFQTSLGGEAGSFARHLALADARARQILNQLDEEEEEEAEQAQVQTSLLQRASARGRHMFINIHAFQNQVDNAIKEKCCCSSPVKYAGSSWKYHRWEHRDRSGFPSCTEASVARVCPAEDDCPCKDGSGNGDEYQKGTDSRFENGDKKVCWLTVQEECEHNCDTVNSRLPRVSDYEYHSSSTRTDKCSLRRRGACSQFSNYYQERDEARR